jgi:hypothetical protein
MLHAEAADDAEPYSAPLASPFRVWSDWLVLLTASLWLLTSGHRQPREGSQEAWRTCDRILHRADSLSHRRGNVVGVGRRIHYKTSPPQGSHAGTGRTALVPSSLCIGASIAGRVCRVNRGRHQACPSDRCMGRHCSGQSEERPTWGHSYGHARSIPASKEQLTSPTELAIRVHTPGRPIYRSRVRSCVP